ncbi:MAG: hypothetical protein CMO80_02065 [Verrucomicrobiales bacterium]|nr:hypothetical protein [Verrucomicrobiales bacterium]|tara:strand:- start:3583 stop:3777 length:195 start_codon:yes stop_codon:yes gene_type:complete
MNLSAASAKFVADLGEQLMLDLLEGTAQTRVPEEGRQEEKRKAAHRGHPLFESTAKAGWCPSTS